MERLSAAILDGRALHAYLFTGADSAQTDAYMRSAASLIIYERDDAAALAFCPDYTEYDGSISISKLRDEIRPEIYKQTYGGRARVVAFRSASDLSPLLQNAMLKILEEPPVGTHFILTGNEYGLLPTILSRCLILRIGLSTVGEIAQKLLDCGAAPGEAKTFAEMSGGIAARAIRLYKDDDFRLLRSSALSAFILALQGAPDFKWARLKRDRADWIEANEIMLLFCHDMFQVKCGFEPSASRDKASELRKLCSVFTIGQIGCIIDRLTDNAARLSTNVGGGACFDRLFAELTELRLSM